LQARLRYMLSADGLVDLVSVLPFWLAFAAPSELRVLLMFRIVRFLKLTRYSPALRSLLMALYAERRALSGCVVILAGMTLLSGVLVHLAERDVQPQKFGTIPDAMWWALVTLGTIGYGDAVPVTAAGRLIAALTIVGSFVMVALPVGIIWSRACRCLPASTRRRSPTSCGFCGRRRSMPARSSHGAAILPIRCISSPEARSILPCRDSTSASASATSSARSPCCSGPGVPPPSRPSPAPAC
jgi:hypothetical protein